MIVTTNKYAYYVVLNEHVDFLLDLRSAGCSAAKRRETCAQFAV